MHRRSQSAPFPRCVRSRPLFTFPLMAAVQEMIAKSKNATRLNGPSHLLAVGPGSPARTCLAARSALAVLPFTPRAFAVRFLAALIRRPEAAVPTQGRQMPGWW